MKAIGIDIGTTTISAVVMDTQNKEVVEARTIQNSSFIQNGNEWERIQDVTIIMGKATAAVAELLGKYGDVSSIGLTGQMHGIVYVDENGMAVSPLYTWQDGRGNLCEGDGLSVVGEITEKCGLPVASGYGIVTHIYNQKHELVPETAVSFCSIGDYLGMRLTGRKTPLVHISNAASFGFFDGRNTCFDQEKLEKCGVDPKMLPEVTAEFACVGEHKGIPVTVALGDNQASFLGSVGLQKGVILLNMGTGGQISVLSDQYFEAPGIEARPLVKDRFLLVGSSLCGGRAYAILEKFLKATVKAATGSEESQYDLMGRLAREAKDAPKQSDSMRVVTTFNGTRVNPQLRGEITNISEDNFTLEGMVFGVLEGMSRELYDMYEIIHKGVGIKAEHLVASGNGYRMNQVLQEISSEMFEADLTLAPYKEEAACGAAISSIQESPLQSLML